MTSIKYLSSRRFIHNTYIYVYTCDRAWSQWHYVYTHTQILCHVWCDKTRQHASTFALEKDLLKSQNFRGKQFQICVKPSFIHDRYLLTHVGIYVSRYHDEYMKYWEMFIVEIRPAYIYICTYLSGQLRM